jgi:hypothetical protein
MMLPTVGDGLRSAVLGAKPRLKMRNGATISWRRPYNTLLGLDMT